MRTTPQHRDGAPGGDGSFGDQFAAAAAETVDDAVHERIVGGAVDLRDRDPVLDRGEHGDLPIGDMPGEDDHAAPRGDRPIDVLDAVRLDSAATRPRLSQIPAMMCSISASESPGKARPMLRRARLEMPSRGPIVRASVPPIAEAQSIGSNPNAPKHSAAPHPSSWWVKPIG